MPFFSFNYSVHESTIKVKGLEAREAEEGSEAEEAAGKSTMATSLRTVGSFEEEPRPSKIPTRNETEQSDSPMKNFGGNRAWVPGRLVAGSLS